MNYTQVYISNSYAFEFNEMGNHQSAAIAIVPNPPKLTFPNFSYNTDLLESKTDRDEAFKHTLTLGDWLAIVAGMTGNFPDVNVTTGTISLALQILGFIIEPNSLEQAFIDSKINEAVEKQATADLKREIRSVVQSPVILRGDITKEERVHEIKNAEQGCRTILNKFRTPEGVLWARSLESAPILTPFSAVYLKIIQQYIRTGNK